MTWALVLAVVGAVSPRPGAMAVTARGPASGTIEPTYTDTRDIPGTTDISAGLATAYPHQGKLFYASGLWWFFYGLGTNHVYRTSADGDTWSGTTTARAGSDGQGHRIGLVFDGTYVHYAYCAATAGADILYRRGTLNANGTITWSAVEQTVVNVAVGKTVGYTSVVVDTNGIPWIGYSEFDGSGFNYPADGKVVKATVADGTWTTAADFPYTFLTSSVVYPYPQGVKLSSGKTYWAWSRGQFNGNAKMGGRLWNGTAWANEEDASSLDGGSNWLSVVADGDIVHMAFLEENSKLMYRRRSAAGTWASEVELATLVGLYHMAVLLTLDNDRVQACWVTHTTHLVVCRNVRAGVMAGAAATVQDEGTPDVVAQHPLQMARYPSGLMLGYVTEPSGPFNVTVIKRAKR